MTRKAIIVSDPGMDGALAIALALLDPQVELLGLVASAGNVSSEQATRNIHIIIEQMDPARWPRLGTALAASYGIDGTRIHGAGGLGGLDFPCAQLHHPHPGDKLICDLVRQYPREVTIVLLGPATMFLRALDRDPELSPLVQRIIMVGGAWREPGDVSAVAEMHFFCDPVAARKVLHSGIPVTLLPLDVTRKLLLSPSEVLSLPASHTPTVSFLQKVLQHGIAPTSSHYGVEGVFVQDVLGVIALTQSGAVTTRAMIADVETRGELTLGMSVFDVRWGTNDRPNVELAVNIDLGAVRDYIHQTLGAQE
jgi:inosine-uridine nucleoside N-ribohydrolase